MGKKQTNHGGAPEGRKSLSHTYSQLHAHIVFSTKHRYPFLDGKLRRRLFPYMGGIIRELDGKPIRVNGVADHVHILASLPPRIAVSDVLRTVKANSSRWIHDEFPSLAKFAWQTGYGVFSVSHRDLESVLRYVNNQEEHHRVKTFQEEFLSFLHEYGIEYDEKYLWD